MNYLQRGGDTKLSKKGDESINCLSGHKDMLAKEILLLNFLLHHAIQKKGKCEDV